MTPEPNGSAQDVQKTETPATGSATIQINGAGATFPLPIYMDWAYAYTFVDPMVEINYRGIGSGAGKKAIIERTVDFAGSDSILTTEENETDHDLLTVPILAGAVVVIYQFSPSSEYPQDFSVPTLVLDRQTLVDIFNGTLVRWNDPRLIALNPQLSDHLPDALITVVHRSDASGTTELFTRSLSSFSPDWIAGSALSVDWPIDETGTGIGANGNQGVAEAVINTGNSLGYVELSFAISNRLAYADMINRAGRKVTANVDSLTSALNEFGATAFEDSLTATIVDGYGEGSWPISGYSYIILPTTSMTDCVKARKLFEYLQWTLTEGSAARRAAKLGYAVLPASARNQVLDKLRGVTCKGQSVMK